MGSVVSYLNRRASQIAAAFVGVALALTIVPFTPLGEVEEAHAYTAVKEYNTLNEYSWRELAVISDCIASGGTWSTYYNQKFTTFMKNDQRKSFTMNGTTYQVRIAGINHDSLTVDGMRAGLTFQFCTGIQTAWHSTGSGKIGYAGSDVRTKLNKGGSIYNALPDDLKAVLTPTFKEITANNSSGDGCLGGDEYLFLPSAIEIFGATAAASYVNGEYEGYQYEAMSYVTAKGGPSSGYIHTRTAQFTSSSNTNVVQINGTNTTPVVYAPTYGTDLAAPLFCLATPMRTMSWSELADISDLIGAGDTELKTEYTDYMKYDVPRYISMNINYSFSTMRLRIIGIAHDTKTAGGTAGLTLQFCSSLSSVPFNSYASTWANSSLRASLNGGTIWSYIPTALRQYIVPVNKLSNASTGTATYNTNQTTSDSLFLLSCSEIDMSNATSTLYRANEGTLYEKFVNAGSSMPVAGVYTSSENWLRSVVTWYYSYNSSYTYCPTTVRYYNWVTPRTGTTAWSGNCQVTPAFCLGGNRDMRLNSYTWDQLRDYSDKIATGDTSATSTMTTLMNADSRKRVVINGASYMVRIVGINHDDKSTSGKAGLTFQFCSSLGKMQFNSSNNVVYYPNAAISNSVNALVNSFPADLQSVICVVNKKSFNSDPSATTPSVSTNAFAVFLPSRSELKLSSATRYLQEGTTYEAFNNGLTCFADMPLYSYVWMRSLCANSNAGNSMPMDYYISSSTGTPTAYYTNYATDNYEIQPMFCIGSPKDYRLDAYTWPQLKAASDKISNGDTTTINTFTDLMKSDSRKNVIVSGVTYEVRIIGIKHDDKSSGEGKAGLTFQFCRAPMLATWNTGMINTYNNSGVASAMTSVYNNLPSDLKSVICAVSKNTANRSGTTKIYTNLSLNLFPMSLSEWWGTGPNSAQEGYVYEGKQYLGSPLADENRGYVHSRTAAWTHSGSTYYWYPCTFTSTSYVQYSSSISAYVMPCFAIGSVTDYRLDAYTWPQLKTIADDIAEKNTSSSYYSTMNSLMQADSRKKVIFNGLTYQVRIVGINHDAKSSGGKAGLTFQFTTPLGDYCWENRSDKIYTSGSYVYSKAGWAECKLRDELNSGSIYSNLPTDLQGVLCAVDKKSKGPYGVKDASNTSIVTSSDKMFLPSISELTSNSGTKASFRNPDDEGTVYEAMAYVSHALGDEWATSQYRVIRSMNTSSSTLWTGGDSILVMNTGMAARYDSGYIGTGGYTKCNGSQFYVQPMFCIGQGDELDKYTWQQLADISDKIVAGDGALVAEFTEYMNKSATHSVKLKNGQSLSVKIAALNHDERVDSPGKIGITWVFTTVLPNKASMMASNSTTDQLQTGVWETSDLRAMLQPGGDFFAQLPDDLTSVMLGASKDYNLVSSTSKLTCKDYMWVPSYREVGYTSESFSSGEPYTIWQSGSDSARNYKEIYWLRDRSTSNASYYCALGATGSISSSAIRTGTSSYGVVAMFATGNTPSLDRYTWAEISVISDEIANGESDHITEFANYMANGATKKVTLTTGQTMEFRIVGMNQDVGTDGEKPLGLTWASTGMLPNSYRWSSSSTYVTWADSELRTKMQKNGDIFKLLPTDMQAAIVPAMKDYNKADRTLSPSIDYMWVPSNLEIGNDYVSYTNEKGYAGKPYTYYSNNGIVMPVNSPSSYYYLRDLNPAYGYTHIWYQYNESPAEANNSYGNSNWGVMVMFATGTPPTLDQYSWEQLKEISDGIAAGDQLRLAEFTEYMNSSSIKTVKFAPPDPNEDVPPDSTKYQYGVRIIGINHDVKSNGEKAGLTFQFVNLIGSTPFASGDSDYIDSTLHQVLGIGGTVWSQLPPDLAKVICQVEKTTTNLNGASAPSFERLFAPSVTEMGLSLANDSGTAYELFSNASNRSFPSTIGYFWTRSHSGNSPVVVYGYGNGNVFNNWYTDSNASSRGIVPCFAIGDSSSIVEDEGYGGNEEEEKYEDSTEDTTLVIGDTITYTCEWKSNIKRWDIAQFYTSLIFEDLLPRGLAIQSYELYRISTDKNGDMDIATLNSSAGDWKITAQPDHTKENPHYKVEFIAKNLHDPEIWPLAGETYRMVIVCKVVGGGPEYKNTFNVYPNNVKLTSNVVTITHFYPKEPEIDKSADKHEAYIGEEVTYTVKVAMPETPDGGLKDWSCWDELPENLSFDIDSFEVQMPEGVEYHLDIEKDEVAGVERGIAWKITGPLWLNQYGSSFNVIYKGFAVKHGTITNTAHFKWLAGFSDDPGNLVPEYKEITDDETVEYRGYPVIYHIDPGTDREMEWTEYVTEITAMYKPHDADTYVHEGTPLKLPNSVFIAAWYLDDRLEERYKDNRDLTAGPLHLYARNKFTLTYETSDLADIRQPSIYDELYTKVRKNTEKNIWEVVPSSHLNMPDDEKTLYGSTDVSTNEDHLQWESRIPYVGKFPWADEGIAYPNPTIYNYGDHVTLRAPRVLKVYTPNYNGRLRAVVCAPWTEKNNVYYSVPNSVDDEYKITEVYMDDNKTVYKDWALSTFDGVIDQNQ